MKVHILGIGGSGASAIAAIAISQGFEVTGCDKSPFNEYTKDLPKPLILEGHSPDHLEGVDLLAVTPAVFSADPDNEELKTAKEKGIKVVTWQEFMGEYLEKDKFVIAICGTHGKSTTTAMIGQVLEAAGLDPTVELGATVEAWDNKNHRVGQGKYFVTEADEFNRNFLVTHPEIAVVTTIEMDHPETFKDFNEYKEAFVEFLSRAKVVIYNGGDHDVVDVVEQISKKLHDIKLVDYFQNKIDFGLEVMGEYNRLNASAAYQVGLELGIDQEVIKHSLAGYSGIGRRMQLMGYLNGIKVYSDYGHHPTEIKATIEGLKERFHNEKVWLIYQPHMYTRTKALWDEFVKVFRELPVEKVFILDIFKSREDILPDISSEKLVREINKPHIEYVSPDEKILDILSKLPTTNNQLPDHIVFMGAGPIHELAKKISAINI